MADKSSQLVLEALGRAALEPEGLPLFGQKGAPVLFAGTALARQAAQQCKDQDLLRVVGTAARGKGVQEVAAITPKGVNHLLSRRDPLDVLDDLVRAVEGREKQLADSITAVRHMQASLEAVKNLAAAALKRHGATAPDCAADLLRGLAEWSAANRAEDCPLPALYRQISDLTIGQFHDAIRQLCAEERIYLHPWTGPLCDLPEPSLALLVGHEIAYYASPRTS